jgi:XTP/dITP diphosphohydrolase
MGKYDVPVDAKLILATHSSGKLGELRALLRAQPGLSDLPESAIISSADLALPAPIENGISFEANALIKARAIAKLTNLPTVADDSGLAVDVLGGAPGIFSARWCGQHGDDKANLDLLLAQLAEVTGKNHRKAAFICAAVLVMPPPDNREFVQVGVMRGHLIEAPRGEGGFGYDPIFVPDAQPDKQHPNRTSAELSAAEKNQISHRGQAFQLLAPQIAAVLPN